MIQAGVCKEGVPQAAKAKGRAAQSCKSGGFQGVLAAGSFQEADPEATAESQRA